jgi:predicted SAM-dependent methyltransferase
MDAKYIFCRGYFPRFVNCPAKGYLRKESELRRITWVPESLENTLFEIGRGVRRYRQRHALQALAGKALKQIVIGSSSTGIGGWVSTDKETLNLLSESTWMAYFSPNSLDAILAEHVWEHLSPDPAYIEGVRPGGTGPGAEDHKVLYTYASFRELFANLGFDVRLLEYFDEQGQFQCNDWNPSDGMIRRSQRFDPRNFARQLSYTSIILDAVKPVG